MAWFKFAQNEDIISVERLTFVPEYSDESGNYFRAPDHFKDKLIKEGGCTILGMAPEGAPDNLPPLQIGDQKVDLSDSTVMNLRQALSDEKSTSSALQAQLGAVMHENDQLKLQIHDLTEENLELKEKLDDAGVEVKEE